MIQKCTIYEMRKTIETNFTNMSSNSTGSIQATVKKLLDQNMIRYNEFVKNSVNKKVYEITDAGKAYFYDSISKPMLYKEKSMEMSKFFFMGFVEKEKRLKLIESYITELESQVDLLELIKLKTEPHHNLDDDYFFALQEKGVASELEVKDLYDIALFQLATLDLSIDKLKFEIQWFDKFKERLN